MKKRVDGMFLRNFIFGVEDSLVSTVGLLSGIAAEHIPQATILLTGIVYIFVEAFSMAVGSFLSEESVEEYATGQESSNSRPAFGAVIMFVSFVIAGFAPLLPYLLLPEHIALIGSIVFSLVVLFIVGLVNASVSKVKPWRRAFRMVVLGGFAIIVGVLVGKFVRVG
jgi:VIT1/CCC1 family predicted Fe2+/Mn2+ transporter